MKSAYLIIAHDNFQVLQCLLNALDSTDVDIYVHIDSKVDQLPDLNVCSSKLIVLKNRKDVRWGNISQIEAELLLWEVACSHGPYRHYHLISGTHFPLKPMADIKSYFNRYKDKNIFSYIYTDEYEIDLKIRRINLFTSTFKHRNQYIQVISQFCWKTVHKIQKMFGYKKYPTFVFYKASNWCSLTEAAVRYILSQKIQLIQTYKYSFCGDEFFAITALLQSELRGTIEFREDYLKVDFCDSNPRIYGLYDFDNLVNSNYMFARKFSDIDIKYIAEIYNNMQTIYE